MCDPRAIHSYLTHLAQRPGYVVTYHPTGHTGRGEIGTHYRLDYRGAPHLRLGETFGDAKRSLLAWRNAQ